MYVYNATVTDVHDGDTITVTVDLGWNVSMQRDHVRVAGISARELSMPGGPEARDYVQGLLPLGTRVVVRSVKVDQDPADVMSFDRYVLYVQLADGRDLGAVVIAAGFAVPWDGKSKPTPYPPWPIPTGGPA